MSSSTHRTFTVLTAVALMSALLLSVSPAGAKKKDRSRYNLIAQGKGHVGLAAGRASRLTLTISSWSTEEELAEIREIIARDDAKEIRKALGKAREVGRLQVPGQSGIDLIYSIQFDELDAEGKGTGVISPAIEPAMGDDGQLKIVHSVADPITLTSVTLQQ